MNKISNERASIDVCIATFLRPLPLLGLLASLREQGLGSLRMRIIVVDNDRGESARRAVEDFRAASGLDVAYVVEPLQNIALARNTALRHSSADYVAFIDDDETASRLWLRSLWRTMVDFNADAVFGPVLRTLPADAPAWATPNFRMQRRETGAMVEFGGAGNVLIARRAFAGKSMRFNPAFGLTGGEDTEFFYRLFLAGRRLIWCDEAIVTEPVAKSRLSLEWIRRRGFRSGQTYSRIFVSRYSSLRRFRWFLTKAAHLAGGLCAAPLLRLFSYSAYVTLTVRIAATFGQLSCCFSERDFEEYKAQTN